MMKEIIEMYKRGAITADHLVVECLHRMDPSNPDLVLNCLPPDILARMIRFAVDYTRNGMVTNYGVLPTDDQVVAARRWIERTHPEVLSVTHS